MMRADALFSAFVLLVAAAGAAPAQDRTPWQNYILRCTGCHGLTGAGSLIGGIPDFNNSVGAIAGDDVGRTYLMHVPGVVTANLNDREIAEVMNFVVKTWSDGAPAFDEAEVRRRREIEVQDVVKLRREIADRLAADGVSLAPYPWP